MGLGEEKTWLVRTIVDRYILYALYLPSLNRLHDSLALTNFTGGLDMSHSLDFTIREQLAKYLAHEISLHDFKEWFFSNTWDVDRIGYSVLTDLVYGIKLNLAEFSRGT